MPNILTAALATALLATASSAAQTLPPRDATAHDRAIAAGYKALMICGALNAARVAGGTRTVASVEANELRGTYREYDALLPKLKAEVSDAGVQTAKCRRGSRHIISFVAARCNRSVQSRR